MKQYITSSETETKNIAAKIARSFRGHVIGLSGELGAGKTVFVQGFAKGLGIKEKIISPTFVLIRQHKIPKATTSSPRKRGSINKLMDSPIKSENDRKMFYHIDLYRLENLEDVKHIGIEEIMENTNNIILIEWAEKIRSFLPKNVVYISFKTITTNQREISIKSIIH